MKLLTNKFFILGNLFLLLLAIPITLFFIGKQQETRSKAAASTTLYFAPASLNTSTSCTNFTADVMVDPGQNIVSIVDMYLTYDASKISITAIAPSSNFSTIVREASISNGTANISVSVGGDVSKAIQTLTKVATITFKPLNSTSGTTSVAFDTTKTRAFSLSSTDQPTENVLKSSPPANVTIAQSATCPNGPSTTPTASPSPTPPPATTTPVAANTAPICTEFTITPASGSAPFTSLLAAKGNDPDGLVTKTTFNFGDGQVQDINAGMNLQSVSVQANHTYIGGGNFNATVIFTDNRGGISTICAKTVVASGAAATPTPTATAIPTVITATPTIAQTGTSSTTLGVIGGVILSILGGILLLTL